MKNNEEGRFSSIDGIRNSSRQLIPKSQTDREAILQGLKPEAPRLEEGESSNDYGDFVEARKNILNRTFASRDSFPSSHKSLRSLAELSS